MWLANMTPARADRGRQGNRSKSPTHQGCPRELIEVHTPGDDVKRAAIPVSLLFVFQD